MIRSRDVYKILSPEAIFVLYCWGFTLLKYLLNMFRRYSTILLFAYLVFLGIVSISQVYSKKGVKKKGLLLILFLLIIYCFDMLFRRNGHTIPNLITFCMYGAMPIFFVSQITDYRKVLEYFYLFSIVNFLLYFYDPIINYRYFGDYMGFGLNLALPAYMGMYVGRKYLNKKAAVFLEAACLIELIIYSNRSAILAVVFFWMINIKPKKKTAKTYLLYFSVFFIVVNIMLFLKEIIAFCIDLLYMLDTSSFALERIYLTLSDFDIAYLFAGRLEIWKNAVDLIKSNFLFGTGTGGYQVLYHTHPHNIILDMWSQYGVIVLIFFFVLFVCCIRRMKQSSGDIRVLFGVLLSMCFPLLLLSNTFYSSLYFWGFLALGLNIDKKCMSKCKMEEKNVSRMF